MSIGKEYIVTGVATTTAMSVPDLHEPERYLGYKQLEFSNHLGNVLVTLSDRKTQVETGGGGSVDYFMSDVRSYSDYSAFGVALEGRHGGSYRYGMNGVEKESEINSGAWFTDYRVVDSRLGRWISTDPIVKPWESSYAGFANNPIYWPDPSGLDPEPSGGGNGNGDEQRFTVKQRVRNWRNGQNYWNQANKYAVDNHLKSWQVTYGLNEAVIQENHVTKSHMDEAGNMYGIKEHDELSFRGEGMYYSRVSSDVSGGYTWKPQGTIDGNNAVMMTYAEGMSYDQICNKERQLRSELPNTSEITYGIGPDGKPYMQQNLIPLQRPAIDPIDFAGGLVGGIFAAERVAAQNGVNQTGQAILRNGYYEANGFKFSEAYYNKLWSTGRGAPGLVAGEVWKGGASKAVLSASKPGFSRCVSAGWEMVYNPATKEVWHLQPVK